MESINPQEAVVNCECGEQHRLMEGIDALIYWCGDNLREIVSGDYVDIKEE